jgi:hypothetical protein
MCITASTNESMEGKNMNEQNRTPAWLPGASIGMGVGIGSAIGNGAGGTFTMKLIIGAAAAVLIALAAQFILAKIFSRPRE